MKTPWEILEVAEDVSLADLKAAHRRLSRRYHPDVHAGESAPVRAAATAAMQAVNDAYATLVVIARERPVVEAEPVDEPTPAAPAPGTDVLRYRRENRWDQALAAGSPRGRLADVAA